MKRLVVCLALLSLLSSRVWGADDPFAAGVRTTPWLKPEDERAGFRVPEGFEVQLVAAEPEILKPMNLAFDARGRLWVTDSQEYPYAAPLDKPGRDSIKILEDTDGDGRADKITTFADGLNIPIGIYPYKNGAIAYSIPYIYWLEDTDGDDRADRREVLYGPMGWERDTHGMNNAFRRGFDGWLYSCHGFNNETTVKGRDGNVVKMQSGNTYRMRLDGSRVEHFTHGQVNPFGMTFDPLGNLFTADCHSKPIYQLLRNGYYPSFGKPDDGLGYVPPMMDHLHGSTAIAGVAFYTGDNFPEQFRGNTFSGNVMTSRINRNSLIYHGSTIVAKEEPDFLSAADPWFRPVDIQLGPDGALYVSDFYNRIIGHYEVPLPHPGRDRTSGRIWKIVYRGDDPATKPAKMPGDLRAAGVSELIVALDNPVLTTRMLATNELTDRIGVSASVPVAKAFESTQSPRVRVHALWVLQRLGALTEAQLASAARDASREVRVHAQKVLADTPKWSDSYRKLAVAGLDDSDAFVQRAAADAMGLHPQADQIAPLLALLSHVPEADNHLRQVIRISLRDQLLDPAVFEAVRKQPASEADARALAEIANAIQTQAAGAYLVDHVQKFTESRPQLVKYLQHAARLAPETNIASLAKFVQDKFADDADLQMELLQSIISGLDQRGSAPGDALRTWGTALVRRVLDDNRVDTLGWTNIPMAGKPRQEDPWVIQQRVSADGDKSLFYGSLPRGEQLTGTYRSDSFELPAKLSFWCAGHVGFPNQPPLDKNYIRLRDATSNELLAESRPPRNDTAQKFEWDLSKHAGKRGYVELVDGDEGTAYAWLAVGRFSMPGLNPSRTGERRQAAADLAARLKLQDIKPQLTALLASESTDASTRSAAARALVALDPDSRRGALVPLLSDSSLPSTLRTQIAQALIDAKPEQTEKTLAEAMKAVPQRLQLQAAEALAGDNPGAETLFRLISAGQASPRLLQRPSVRQKLDVLKLSGLTERIGELTARLPSENEQLQKLLAERRDAYQKTAGSAEKGAAHFAKHCAVCHQIGGKGAVVGPQLDGIGLRGLERLLEDVLDPNRNVDVAFRTTTLVLDDGKATSGLFRREEGASLVLVDNQGKEFTVPAARVEERVKSELSLMPANVSELLTEPEFRDLVAYLLAQRTQPAPKE